MLQKFLRSPLALRAVLAASVSLGMAGAAVSQVAVELEPSKNVQPLPPGLPGGADVLLDLNTSAGVTPDTLSKYWIGVEVKSLDEDVRKLLKLSENQGVLVLRVLPDSPAEKSGFKANDILLQVGETNLSTRESLIENISKSEGKELSFKVWRDREVTTVKVSPAERPAEFDPAQKFQTQDDQAIIKWREKMARHGINLPPQGQANAFAFAFPGPGLAPPSLNDDPYMQPLAPKLPANLSITITRVGDEPAKITVKRDDKTWELTDKELDKLPEDIRPHVQHMLGRQNPQLMLFDKFAPRDFLIQAVPPNGAPQAGLRVELPEGLNQLHNAQIQRQMEQMQAQLKAMQEEMEKSREEMLKELEKSK
ncbi:MAG: PDZ domain-containing protein [Pirellulales bacterium]|nr:PDZ domain-containing protein [Pirellulales bacterium]